MTTTPHPRLLAAAAAWTGLATAATAWPVLAPAALATGLGLAALAAVDALWLRRRPPLRLTRELPERAHLGRALELELVLVSEAQEAVLAEVFEDLPRDLVDPDPVLPALRVPARGTQRLRVPLLPRQRGDRPLGPPLALERSPLGFWRRRLVGPSGQRLRVDPDLARLVRTAALDPRALAGRLGTRPVRRRGEGLEFDSLRDWTPGDDPRRLDWAASARRGRPVVRQFAHERHHTVLIALDASRLMAGRVEGRSKLDHAVDAALALAAAGVSAGDRVGMTVFDRELRGFVAPRRRRGDLGAFVELVRPAEPRLVEADFRALARGLVSRQRQRALVVVLTDFVEAEAAPFTAPLALLARQHRVLFVALRDRLYRELEPGQPRGVEPLGLERRLVLGDLLQAREIALARLRRQGLETLDLPPEGVTAPLLNRYLELREVVAL